MKKLIIGLLSVTTVALSGCGPLNMPPAREYALSAKKIGNKAGVARSSKTILVSAPVPAPGYATRNMVYEITPFELQAYTQSQWVAPPASMLTPILVDALRGARYFKAVASPPFTGKTDYQLNTYLIALDQSFMRPTSQVRLVLSATLIDAKSMKVLATKTFVRKVNAPGNNAYSGVLAANRAASWVAKQMAHFAVRAVR